MCGRVTMCGPRAGGGGRARDATKHQGLGEILAGTNWQVLAELGPGNETLRDNSVGEGQGARVPGISQEISVSVFLHL